MGYTRVMAFLGGIPEWNRFNYPMEINREWAKIRVKKLSPDKVRVLAADPDVYLLDVRPLISEREEDFIIGAKHCPLVLLHEHYEKLPMDKEIVIADWAMKQSSSAAKFLLQKGYHIRGVLKGGMERWRKEELPVEKRTMKKGVVEL